MVAARRANPHASTRQLLMAVGVVLARCRCRCRVVLWWRIR
jgi:hypothetical protein